MNVYEDGLNQGQLRQIQNDLSALMPQSWVFTTLGEAFKWGSGGTPLSGNAQFYGGDIPWLVIGDLNDGVVHDSATKITELGLKNSSARLVDTGSILLAMYGSIGKLGIAGKTLATNQAIAFAKTNEIAPLYLFFFLKYVSNRLASLGKGATQLNISQTVIKAFPFVLAPKSEQHRIVAKIEELFSELDKGVESLKTAQAQLKVYRQALMKHAFEGKLTEKWRAENRDMLKTADALFKRIQQEREERYQQQMADWKINGGTKPKAPKSLPPLTAAELAELPELPHGWGWTRLGNMNVDVSDGPFGSNLKSSDYVDSGVRVVRLENIGALKFIEEKESYVTNEKYELLKRHTVTSGDIVFSSFIIENVRVALVPPSITKAINKADCFCVRFSGKTMSNIFAVLFLSTRHVYKQLESLIHGVGRPRINTTQLKDVFIPVCSAAEQQVIIAEIEARLSEVDQLELTIATAMQQSEALHQSILKKAFSGQLVPQNPDDEPASELLARIKEELAKAPRGRVKASK